MSLGGEKGGRLGGFLSGSLGPPLGGGLSGSRGPPSDGPGTILGLGSDLKEKKEYNYIHAIMY